VNKQTTMLVGEGIYPNISRDRYDSVDRTNFSILKWMRKSAAHYKHHLIHRPKDTDAMKVGRVVHVAAFEPERFRSVIAVWDGGTRKGKDWDEFKLRNAGKELLTVAEYERCLAIHEAAAADATAKQYVSNGRGEVTMLWDTPATFEQSAGSFTTETIAAKGRIDFDAKDAIVDLKTTKDAAPLELGKQAQNLGYFTQAAWYVDGYAFASGGVVKPYVIVAVESVEPYVVQVYDVTEEDLKLGRIEYRSWLDKLAWCRARNLWPGYAPAGEKLPLMRPPWARPDVEDDPTGMDIEFDDATGDAQ
jgi:hypothetical protein